MNRTASRSLQIAAAALVLTMGQPAMAQNWPRMTGGADNPQCQQAFQLAKYVFQSTVAYPFAPVTPPKDLGSTLSLYTTDLDISGGDALSNDPATFTKITDSTHGNSKMLWQIKPQFGKRLVIADEPFNWRGDWYYVYYLDETVTSDTLLNDLQKDESQRSFKPASDNAWQPPLVLADDTSGQSWVIDRDAGGNGARPDWSVYTARADGLVSRCTIRFMPKVKDAVFLLPAPVQRFAALLDEALGRDSDEGTMHPVTSVRNEDSEAWANATLRPWALMEDPYNTHEQVDDGLQMWSKISGKHRAVYRAILRQYPRAEHSLALYYRTTFHISARDARKMGRYVADRMYREYFVFPGGADPLFRPKTLPPTPWPQQHHS